MDKININDWKKKPILVIINEIAKNKTDEAIAALKELADESLIRKYEPTRTVDKIFFKKCGKCGNDLIQPYNYCRFCGEKILEYVPTENKEQQEK